MPYLVIAAVAMFLFPTSGAAVEVGFSAVDITPDVDGERPVWIAGYGQNRKAESVHDPLYVRAFVLRDGDQRIAFAVADVVGLQRPVVNAVREQLQEFTHVTISSTHNHEGPDVVGIWGQSPFQSGIDKKYMARIKERLVQAIREADAAAKPANASYGTAQDDTLLRDSRLPKVYDGIIRVLKFTPPGSDEASGIVYNGTAILSASAATIRTFRLTFPSPPSHESVKRMTARWCTSAVTLVDSWHLPERIALPTNKANFPARVRSSLPSYMDRRSASWPTSR